MNLGRHFQDDSQTAKLTNEGWSSVTHIAERIQQCRVNSPFLALWLDGTSYSENTIAFVHTQELIVWNECL